MALDAVIRSAIQIADNVTKPLQVNVVHWPWIGQDIFGVPQYADSGVTYRAIVDRNPSIRTEEGIVIAIKAKILILQVIVPQGAAGRLEPVDLRDKFILPDGQTGPIIGTPGMFDPTTNRPYFAEVLIGA